MKDMHNEDRPRLPIGPSLLLTLSLLFFMSFFAFTEVKLYRYMVVLVFVLLLLIAVRSKLVTLVAAIPCLLAFLGAGNSPDMPLLLCAVAVIGFGGFAIHAIHPLILSAVPVGAYLLAFGLTGDPIRSLWVLCLVPTALAVAISLHLKLSRTATVAAVSFTLLSGSLALTLAVLFSGETTLSPELFTDGITSFRNWLTAELMSATEAMEASSIFTDLTEDSVVPLVNSFLRLLPAIVITCAEVVSYLACFIAVSLRSTQFPDHPLPQKCLVFRMSAVSAVLFLVCFGLSLLSAGDSDILGIFLVSATNLFLILVPGFALCGFLRIFMAFRQKRILSPVFFIILLIWFAYLVPFILAFIGAIAILRTERAARRDRENQA